MPSQQSDILHWQKISRLPQGVDAVLRRVDVKATLRVVPGNTTTTIDGGGTVYTRRSADFLFLLQDVLDAFGEELKRKDRLEIFGDEYEILPVDGERHYDPSGNYGVIGRMHTLRIGPIPALNRFVHDENTKYAIDANAKYAGASNAESS